MPARFLPQILHMECKDTGEFAHRESTEYEQTEVFNKEVVSTEHGNEEYVHLKSQHDEYEHLEGNMPKNRQRGGEEEAGAAEQPEPMQDEGAEAMPADSPPPMWQPGQSPPEMGSLGAWHHDGMLLKTCGKPHRTDTLMRTMRRSPSGGALRGSQMRHKRSGWPPSHRGAG